MLGAGDEVLPADDVETARGDEPNGDADPIVSPAEPAVARVRILVLTGENPGPGLAEIEVYED